MKTPDGPETIWLEPSCCADTSHGRTWCEDDAFPVCDDGREATKYVRADLAASKTPETPVSASPAEAGSRGQAARVLDSAGRPR